jgi:hypothetical protein
MHGVPPVYMLIHLLQADRLTCYMLHPDLVYVGSVSRYASMHSVSVIRVSMFLGLYLLGTLAIFSSVSQVSRRGGTTLHVFS